MVSKDTMKEKISFMKSSKHGNPSGHNDQLGVLVRVAKDSRHSTFGTAHSLADRGRSADVQPFYVSLQNQFTLVLFRAVVVFNRAVAVFRSAVAVFLSAVAVFRSAVAVFLSAVAVFLRAG
ncbi:hypothetical protein AVEN_270326-1, partial [Araneus ventricosus]